MRVATRRLRAALELFRDVFPKRRLRLMLRDVRRLADALGEVRDLDVMLEALRADVRGRSASQRLVLGEMIEEMQQRHTAARIELARTIEALERRDFPRRFVVHVANETT
jgi:CHAD domain-containing protein